VVQDLIYGLFGGSIYALASMGLVLTYKTTGIFNFAYGGVAMFCAYVFWQLRDRWHVSQWIAIPVLVVVVAPLLGLVLEAIFRPLASVAAEVQIVVALGILAFLVALVPIVFGSSDHNLPSVFSQGTFHLGSRTVVTWNELGTFVVAAALGGALYLLLRRTRLGTATRAVVDNRDLSGLVGVNAATVGRAAWVISAVFAAISGVLLSTSEGLVLYVLPALVIYAFAPAVFARLTSLPLAYLGALALGILQNALARYSSSGFVANLEGSIPYIALFALLVAYGRRLKEVRSSLRPLSSSSLAGSNRFGFGWGIAAMAVVAVLPAFLASSIRVDLAEAMAYSVVALTLVVLTGWTGQISIAQMTFAGVGAFTAAHIAGSDGARFPLAVLIAVLIAVPIGLIVGLPSLRLSGIFLALATMAFALLMDNLVFSAPSISGGLTGLNLTAAKIGPISFRSSTAQYYLCFVVLGLAASGAFWLRRGPVGRRLQMVRDSPNAASTLGASLTVTKLAVFAAGAAVAAVGGALLAVTQQSVDPSNFSFSTSLELLLVVVLGGRSLVSGALVAGALDFVTLLPFSSVVPRYLQLGVAFSVIGVANEPEGFFPVVARQASFCLATLSRRPRAAVAAAPAGPAPVHASHPARGGTHVPERQGAAVLGVGVPEM
jgi:branched-chain amino acid transport system permease protein